MGQRDASVTNWDCSVPTRPVVELGIVEVDLHAGEGLGRGDRDLDGPGADDRLADVAAVVELAGELLRPGDRVASRHVVALVHAS